MIRINGRTIYERDFVGEFPLRFEIKDFDKACAAFFARRGLPVLNFRQIIHNQAAARKRSRKFHARKSAHLTREKGTVMRKLAIAAAMLLGTVALGMGQNVKPSLSVIAIYPHAITLELNAGSYAAPDGFQVRWEWQGSGDRVVQFFGACPQYALQPYQTVQVTIDGVSSDECSTTYNPLPLNCNFPYRFQARTFPYAAESTKVTTLTAPCQ